MLPVTASLVVYRSAPEELLPLLQSLGASELVRWVVVDNGVAEQAAEAGQTSELEAMVQRLGGMYVAAPRNLGFGAGHNLALQSLAEHSAEFHLLVNPDIELEYAVLPALVEAMRARPAAAMLMPRVVYPDGTFQPLCKLLPTPLDFALRRFAPGFLQRLFQRRLDRYEMLGVEHAECNKVPFLSGCFLFTRRALLEKIGGFDERYFLYMEDVDLCRRMARQGDLLYWPHVSVTHGCYRGAYRSRSLMWIFLRSAVRYFGRWGWVFDAERGRSNRAAMACLQEGVLRRAPGREDTLGKV